MSDQQLSNLPQNIDPTDPGKRVFYLFQTPDREAFLKALYGEKPVKFVNHHGKRTYRIYEGFLQKDIDVFQDDDEWTGLTIERYNTLNDWGTQSYVWVDPYPNAIINVGHTEYDDESPDGIIECQVSAGIPEPEVEKPFSELTTNISLTTDRRTPVVDGAEICFEAYDFKDGGIDYSYITLSSDTVAAGPLTNSSQEAYTSSESKENTAKMMGVIHKFYEQGLITPVSETPLHTIMKKLKMQP